MTWSLECIWNKKTKYQILPNQHIVGIWLKDTAADTDTWWLLTNCLMSWQMRLSKIQTQEYLLRALQRGEQQGILPFLPRRFGSPMDELWVEKLDDFAWFCGEGHVGKIPQTSLNPHKEIPSETVGEGSGVSFRVCGWDLRDHGTVLVQILKLSTSPLDIRMFFLYRRWQIFLRFDPSSPRFFFEPNWRKALVFSVKLRQQVRCLQLLFSDIFGYFRRMNLEVIRNTQTSQPKATICWWVFRVGC